MECTRSSVFRFSGRNLHQVSITGCLVVLLSAVAAVPASSMSSFVDEVRPSIDSVSVQSCSARQLNVSYTVSGEDPQLAGRRTGYCLKLRVLARVHVGTGWEYRTHTDREECLSTGAYPVLDYGWFGYAEIEALVRIRYEGTEGDVHYSGWSDQHTEAGVQMNTNFC